VMINLFQGKYQKSLGHGFSGGDSYQDRVQADWLTEMHKTLFSAVVKQFCESLIVLINQSLGPLCPVHTRVR
jgi:hypothetical protein